MLNSEEITHISYHWSVQSGCQFGRKDTVILGTKEHICPLVVKVYDGFQSCFGIILSILQIEHNIATWNYPIE